MQSVENPGGRQIYYGIREHAWGGDDRHALHGGVLPLGARSSSSATTCVARSACRALEGARHLLVDPRLGRPRRGRPTHQPSSSWLRCAPCPDPGRPPADPPRPPRRGSARRRRRTDRPHPEPPGDPGAGRDGRACGRRGGTRGIRAAPRGGRAAEIILIGTGARFTCAWKRPTGWRPRRGCARGVDAVLGVVEDQDDEYRSSVLPRASCGSPSRPLLPSAGPLRG